MVRPWSVHHNICIVIIIMLIGKRSSKRRRFMEWTKSTLSIKCKNDLMPQGTNVFSHCCFLKIFRKFLSKTQASGGCSPTTTNQKCVCVRSSRLPIQSQQMVKWKRTIFNWSEAYSHITPSENGGIETVTVGYYDYGVIHVHRGRQYQCVNSCTGP